MRSHEKAFVKIRIKILWCSVIMLALSAGHLCQGAIWVTNSSMNSGRGSHTATLLSDGKLLVVGGNTNYNFGYIPTPTAEVYDPDNGTWTTMAPSSVARGFHSATLLTNGKVLV